MNRRTETKIHILVFLVALMTLTAAVSWGVGRASMREEIRTTIKAQQIAPARVVKVPQLGLTMVPFDRGFLSWTDGLDRPVLAQGDWAGWVGPHSTRGTASPHQGAR